MTSRIIRQTEGERELTKQLADRLRENEGLKDEKILCRKNLARSPKVCSILKDFYGGMAPPLQPEIDIILLGKDTMRAIEVKVFRRRGGTVSLPYYKGIDQALALLRYGFDTVALWQLFDETMDFYKLNVYGAQTQVFLREQLKLPIDFTVLVFRKERNRCNFQPLRPVVTSDLGPLTIVPQLCIDKFPIAWRSSNPLLADNRVREVRKAIRDWLVVEVGNTKGDKAG